MWQELKEDDLSGLKIYADTVKNFFASDEHYEQASEEYLAGQLHNKGKRLKYFLYDDGKKQMCYSLKLSDVKPVEITQTDTDGGMWKVSDLSYWGDWGEIDANGLSQEAVKYGCDYIISYLKSLGINDWYVIFNMDTQRIDELTPNLIPQARIFLQFLNDIQKYCTDLGILKETKPLDDNHFICYFNLGG